MQDKANNPEEFNQNMTKSINDKSSLINKGLGVKKNSDSLTESELRHLLKSASNEGIIGRDQNKIHQKVVFLHYNY